ncbi:ABC transporter ATP-binding protein [Hymenobacter ruricola]|uniref:ABC transporter ATP-binding protein n=1 Tax=Hymenobacter ruricola TaxID=2791023 RepID=A0ABS0I072_9BACT|nr:ABC transporter ATP-binding protein [Hymenobacter ruricola]MBF9220361.1 ABC transporter ATP-binding protein [Hymenobacter ruricola]
MELLTVTNISLLEQGNQVLQSLSFQLPAHRRLALAGASGTGKSTLLQIIAGLIQPSTGEVRVNGDRVRGPAETLVPGHPGVAYLSQKSELPQFLRVEQVLRYANQQPLADAQALFALCRIDHLLARRTDHLSGGEQQRVALARLLLSAPRLLLLDEPFSNLDRVHKRLLQGIIEELSTRLGITCLLVSHDAADTLPWADEILVLQRGRIIQQAPPHIIYHQPVNEYTASLFGDYNAVRGAARQGLGGPGAQFPGSGAVLLVRPEDVVLSTKSRGGLAGVVRAVRFYGSHCEVEVAVPGQAVRVRQPTATVAPGAAVRLSVAKGSGWFIDEE